MAFSHPLIIIFFFSVLSKLEYLILLTFRQLNITIHLPSILGHVLYLQMEMNVVKLMKR